MYSGAVRARAEGVPVGVMAVRPKTRVDGTCTGVPAEPPLGPAVTVARRWPGNDSLACSPDLKPVPATLMPAARAASAAESVMCGPVVTGRTVTVRWSSAWSTRPSPPTALALNVSTLPWAGTGTPSVQLIVPPEPLSVAWFQAGPGCHIPLAAFHHCPAAPLICTATFTVVTGAVHPG